MWDTEVWRPCCSPPSHTPFWPPCSPCLRLQDRGEEAECCSPVTWHSSDQSARTFLTEICKMATAEPETNPSPPHAEEDGAEDSGKEMVSPEAYIKHPLQNRWSLWFFKNDKSKTWQANLRLISKFDTVEDFWALYNHIQLSSNLMSGCDYSLFKDGIEPMWEDEQNKRGGRWLITLTKQQRRSDLDRFWLETLLCLVGEAFDDYSDDVCGAVVNIRNKGDKIAVWTSDFENREAVTHIGFCETQSGGGGKSNLHAKITRTGPSAAAMTLTERHRETQSCTLI
ncbi:hypothetical protein CCH79_00020545, partial [Gambusia affinis]